MANPEYCGNCGQRLRPIPVPQLLDTFDRECARCDEECRRCGESRGTHVTLRDGVELCPTVLFEGGK
jgi:hypothetical protein